METEVHCLTCARLTLTCLPCNVCPDVVFCSMDCLEKANKSFHKYECKMRLYGIIRHICLGDRHKTGEGIKENLFDKS